jgi:hypothetical protein
MIPAPIGAMSSSGLGAAVYKTRVNPKFGCAQKIGDTMIRAYRTDFVAPCGHSWMLP